MSSLRKVSYLIIADLLGYLKSKPKVNSKLSINTASLDEIEAILGVKRSIAKEIIKCRVKEDKLTLKTLSKLTGIGPKTLKKAEEEFSWE